MEIRVHELSEKLDLGDANWLLRVSGSFAGLSPGQFCMLSLEQDWPVLLPRPFSYFEADAQGASFLVKIVGTGTQALCDAALGAPIRIVGPLGRGFPEIESLGGKEPVCIAGGVGIAPFLLHCAHRQASGARVPLLYGGAHAGALVGREQFPDGAQDFHLATDDGSHGFHGNVLELYLDLIEKGRIDAAAPVFCCGPDPMMKAVATACADRGVRCFVSLETPMACGFGVCNGCSVAVEEHGRFQGSQQKTYAKTCVEGPVFDAAELRW